MDENDWHPVDEDQMSLSFVKDLKKRKTEKKIEVHDVEDLFE